jgi:hypothetical protein
LNGVLPLLHQSVVGSNAVWALRADFSLIVNELSQRKTECKMFLYLPAIKCIAGLRKNNFNPNYIIKNGRANFI